MRNPGPDLDQLPSPKILILCPYEVKQSDLEICYNNYLLLINQWALVVREARASTESFLSIRMNLGPGSRVAVTNGRTVQNAAQRREKHCMMRVILLVGGKLVQSC